MARLIPVEVTAGEGRLLIATSPSMPKLRVVATSEEELTREIPACIALLFKALHGQDVEVMPGDYRLVRKQASLARNMKP